MFDGIQFIGTQRSGSNLLRLMLNQHSDISAHHPPHLLHTFMPLLKEYGNLESFDRRKMLVQDMSDWVYNNPVTWSPIEFDIEAISQSSRSIIDIFNAIYIAKRDQDRAKIWSCKSTQNIRYLDQLRLQMNLFYIYLYRDGRDVALSFKKAMIGPKHIFNIATKWHIEQQKSLRFIKSLSSESFFMISYESLLENPRRVLVDLCARLEIEFSENMLQYYSSEESRLTSKAGRMWRNVSKPILVHNMQKFHSEMKRKELEIFESVAGGSLNDLGYDILTSANITFSDEQIDLFQNQDEKLRVLSLDRADDDDKESRRPQKKLLRLIMDRIGYQIPHVLSI